MLSNLNLCDVALELAVTSTRVFLNIEIGIPYAEGSRGVSTLLGALRIWRVGDNSLSHWIPLNSGPSQYCSSICFCREVEKVILQERQVIYPV